MNLQEILLKLHNVKRSGNGYSARCPSHDDHRNSLSVSEQDGRILINCFAGCSWKDVIAGLGLESKDLFTERNRAPTDEIKISAVYEFTDEQEEVLYEKLRLEPKDFRYRRLENGKWHWDLEGTRRVPYRLGDLVSDFSADYVILAEGEKDSDRLRSNGFLSSSFKGWQEEFNQFIVGRHVVIISDHDQSGLLQAEGAARKVMSVAASVKITDPFDDLPLAENDGLDISDWFDRGHSVEELGQIIERTCLYNPKAEPESSKLGLGNEFLDLKPLNELLEEPEEATAFIWDNTLPVAGLSVCTAKPKVGKSTFARNLAAAVAKGGDFLGRATTKGKVIYLCLEEKKSEVIEHFRRVTSTSSVGDIWIYAGVTPQNLLQKLRNAIQSYGAILAIIDPLSRVLRVPDFNDYGGMTRAFEPFIDLARETGCHIHILHHDGKVDRNGGDAVLGSTAIFGAVDCHIQLKKRESHRTLLTTQRYGTDFPETLIELDKDTGVVAAKCELQTAMLEETKDAIYAELTEAEEVTEIEIKERIGSKSVTSKAIRALVDEQKLFRYGKGRKGDPYTYRKLPRFVSDELSFADTSNIEKSRNLEIQEGKESLL